MEINPVGEIDSTGEIYSTEEMSPAGEENSVGDCIMLYPKIFPLIFLKTLQE